MPSVFAIYGLHPFLSGGGVAVANFGRVLKISGSTYCIIRINGYGNVKIAPNAVKFAGNVWVGMPALKVVFGKFWIQLGHRQCHAFRTISARRPYLQRNLRIPIRSEERRVG